jgi:hypothetical protein
MNKHIAAYMVIIPYLIALVVSTANGHAGQFLVVSAVLATAGSFLYGLIWLAMGDP